MTPAMNETSAEQIASDWIAFTVYDPDKAPSDVFDRGWVMHDLVQDNPALCWRAIKLVINRYPATQLFAEGRSNPQHICGNLAAGPLEELLSYHGPHFIEEIETEGRRDIRMRWLLGGVWQNAMRKDIWARVQQAADYSYWTRRSLE